MRRIIGILTGLLEETSILEEQTISCLEAPPFIYPIIILNFSKYHKDKRKKEKLSRIEMRRYLSFILT